MKKRKLNFPFSNKKGNAIIDTLTIVVVVVIFIFILMTLYPLFGDINVDMQNDPDLPNATKEMVQTQYTNFPTTFDNLFLFLLAMFWMLVLVASFMVDAHPIFFIIAVILIASLVIIGAIISNTYEELELDASFDNFGDAFPTIHFFMEHIVGFILAIAFSVSFVLYAKLRT